jgi:hypothetical protein
VYAQGKVSIHGWDIAARTIVVIAVRGWRNGVIVDDIVQTDHRQFCISSNPRIMFRSEPLSRGLNSLRKLAGLTAAQRRGPVGADMVGAQFWKIESASDISQQ